MINFKLPWRRNSAPIEKAVAPAIGLGLPELLKLTTRAPSYTDWDVSNAIELGYKANAAVFACISRRSEELAGAKWIASFKGEAMPESPLQRLIDRPNADLAWSQVIEYAVQMLDLAGNVYLSKVTAGVTRREVVELWPLNPRGMKAKPSTTRLVGGWEYRPEGATVVNFAPEQICQIKTSNPDSLVFGLPTIFSSGRGVDIYREARDAQKSSFENRGLSDIAVILDVSTTAEQLEQIRKKYSDRNAGSKNNRAPLFTTRDVKQLGSSPAEMDYIETTQSVINEICSVFGVPPQMIGYLQDATLANYETSRKILWVNTLIPLARRIGQQLTRGVAADFGEGWAIELDLSSVDAIADDYNANVDAAGKLWAMGVPFNEINKRLGLGFEDIEGGDVGYLGGGLIPANVDWSTPPAGTPADMAKALADLGYGKA